MSDLTRFRDHCKAMAARNVDPRDTSTTLGLGCDPDVFGDLAHDLCKHPTCHCRCHPRDPVPTKAERALWTRLAGEVDRYLSLSLVVPDPTDDHPCPACGEPIEYVEIRTFCDPDIDRVSAHICPTEGA